MLKKVMAMLASQYLAIKVRIRAIETRLMIQSLLLRDKKMIRHLFRQRRPFNLSNKVKDEDDDYQSQSLVLDEEDYQSENLVKDEDGGDYQSESIGALTNSVATTPFMTNFVATTPVSTVEVAEEVEDEMETGDDDDDEYSDLRHSRDQSVSVIEMVKNAKEGRGKKFVLEDDIDKVADLFIQKFHHQIRLQKRHSDDD